VATSSRPLFGFQQSYRFASVSQMILNDGREFIANELQKVAEECGNDTFSLRRARRRISG
jgi:hypothetical protein